MNKQSVNPVLTAVSLFKLKNIWPPLVAMLIGTSLFSQGIFKTYPDVIPTFVQTLAETPSGFEIGSVSNLSSGLEIFNLTSTDANGNLLSSTPTDFQGGRPNFRLSTGHYLRSRVDASNHEVIFELLDGSGNLLNSTTFDFPNGDVAGTGMPDEFANGDVFVSYHYGEQQTGPNAPSEKRTIVYAKVNPSTGAVTWQNDFQSTDFVYSAPLRLVKIGPDGSIFAARNEEFPNNQQHFVMKISSAGQILWDNPVSNLERQPLQFAPTPDGGVWYIFNQVIESVFRFNADGTGGGGVLLDPIFMGSAKPTAIAPRPDNGVIAAGAVQPVGASQKSMYTAIIGTDLSVQTNLLDQLPSFPQPRSGIRLTNGGYAFTGSFDPAANPSQPEEGFLITVDANGAFIAGSGTDLELSLNISPPNPKIYETTSLTLTLSNTGSSDATGIEVSFPKPNGVVYEGGNEWSASQGAFNPFGNEVWSLDNLPAGNSATLTVNYFMLTALPTSVYAQVIVANEPDADSTPGNGTPPSANEDDEVAGSINGSTSDPCTGNLTINTQADLNNFPSTCTIWNGNLTIIGQNITDLTPLSNLQQVTGDFQVRENNALTSLAGLENLTSTGGGCAFIHLDALTSITTLSNLQSVGGRLQVSACGALQSLDGLQNVTSAVQLWISDNQNLSECCAVFDLINNGGVVNNNIVIFLNPQFCGDEDEILANCSSNQDICPGDITLSSQADVNAWPGCTIVEGNLVISGNDITDLSPLATLQKVRTLFHLDNNANLTNLTGLENLDSVGVLFVTGNAQLPNLNGLEGLNQQEIVSIIIENNPNLLTVNNLNNFTRSGFLSINDNNALQSVTGLSNLNTMDGLINIENNPALVDISGFSSLAVVNSNLQLINNDGLSTINGFGNLTNIQDILVISSNDQLQNLNGFSNLTNLNDIVVAQNQSLEHLDVFSSIISISGGLNIVNNPMLSDCCGVFPMLNGNGVAGNIFIEGNPMFCASETEILNNCTPSGGVDLELDLNQPNATPAQWSNYAVTATVNNTGGEPATGVQVSFKKPNGVVYVGGNEFTVSQGSFNAFGSEEWTVGSIPAGGSATLTVNYFLLNASSPMAYAQVVAQNEQDIDSTPNNGTPPTPNEDDEASTGGGGPPNLTPDLTISDLQLPNPSVQAGQVLNYNFDAANIGTGAVPGNFTIKSYISSDNVLSADDIQDGIISTGNYGAGFSLNNIPGSSTIPANLAAGQYYLIVKIDADNAVTESNEGNNIVSTIFEVTDGGPTNECGFFKEYGPYPTAGNFNLDFAKANETANGYELVIESLGTSEQRTITLSADFDGNQTDFSDVTEPIVPPVEGVFVETLPNFDLSVERRDANGDPVWTTTVALNFNGGIIQSNVGGRLGVLNDGYLLAGNIRADIGGGTFRFFPWTVKLDLNGNEVQQNIFPMVSEASNFMKAMISPTGEVFTVRWNISNLRLFKLDNNGAHLWDAFLMSDFPSTYLRSVRFNNTGTKIFAAIRDNLRAKVSVYDASTGDFDALFLGDLFSPSSDFSYFEDILDIIPTSDGGFVTGYSFDEPGTPNEGFEWGKIDVSNNMVWWHRIPERHNLVTSLATSDGGYLFVGRSESGNLAMMKVTSTGDLTPTCGGGNPCILSATVTQPVCDNNGTPTDPGDDTFSFSFNVTGSSGVSSVWVANIPDANAAGTTTTMNGSYNVPFELTYSIADVNQHLGGTIGFAVLEPGNLTCTTPVVVQAPAACSGGGGTPDCNAITIATAATPATGQITITGASAPHVLIKVFRPNWTVAFECLDNCSDPLVVSGLSSGNHHIQIKLLDDNWDEICKRDETISVPSIGSSPLVTLNSRQRMAFNSIYPNPSKYWVTLEIYSKENQATVLDFYNQQGQAVHRMEVDLKTGRNDVELDVSQWRSGAYNVIGRGNGHPAYGRFLKAWED